MRAIIITMAILALGYFLRPKPKRGMGTSGKVETGGSHDMAQDPVCGKFVPVKEAAFRRSDGHVRYYCSDNCALKDS